MKRLLTSALCFLLIVCVAAACAQDRYREVFDTGGDAGSLTARFLELTTNSDDKAGDATILTSPDGKVMLLDAGNPGSVRQVVAALEAMGITRIDYLVASHPHVDHVGGFPAVMRGFAVGQVMTSYVEYPTTYYDAYMEEIAAQSLEHVYLSKGDTFSFGESVLVEVLWPEREIDDYEGYPLSGTQFINNHSLALKFTYGESTMLFCGDLYSAAELELVSLYGDLLDSDVLKANHHGDATSSSEPFRDAVSPEITVAISDTLESLAIFQKLQRMGAAYNTHFNGDVKVWTGGDGAYQTLTVRDWDPVFKQ